MLLVCAWPLRIPEGQGVELGVAVTSVKTVPQWMVEAVLAIFNSRISFVETRLKNWFGFGFLIFTTRWQLQVLTGRICHNI